MEPVQQVTVEVTCPWHDVTEAAPYFRVFDAQGDGAPSELTSVPQWAVESLYVWPQLHGKADGGASEADRPSFCGWAAAYSPHPATTPRLPLRMYIAQLDDLDTDVRHTYNLVTQESATLLSLGGTVARKLKISNLQSSSLFAFGTGPEHVLRSRQCETVVDAYRSWMHKRALAVSGLAAETQSAATVGVAAAAAVDSFRTQQEGWPPCGRGPWLLLQAHELDNVLAHCQELLNPYMKNITIPSIDDTDEKIAVCFHDIVSTLWHMYEQTKEGDADTVEAQPYVFVPHVREAWLTACRKHAEWMVLAAYKVQKLMLTSEIKDLLLNAVGPCQCMPNLLHRSARRRGTETVFEFQPEVDHEVWLDPQQSLDSRLRVDAESNGYTGTRHCPDPVATCSYLAGCGRYLPEERYFAEFVTANGCSHCLSLYTWFSRVHAKDRYNLEARQLLCSVGQHFLLHSIWSLTALSAAKGDASMVVLHAHTLHDMFVKSTSTPGQQVECTIEIGGVGLAKPRENIMRRVLNSFDYWTLCLKRANLSHISDQLCHAYEFATKAAVASTSPLNLTAGSTTMMWPWLRSHRTLEQVKHLLHSSENMKLVADEDDNATAQKMLAVITLVGKMEDAQDDHVALWSYLPLLLELSLAIEVCKVDVNAPSVHSLSHMLTKAYGIDASQPKHVRACARAVLLMGTAAEIEQNKLCYKAAAHVKQLDRDNIISIINEVHNGAKAAVQAYVTIQGDEVVKMHKVCYSNLTIHSVCTGS